jgi:hypothetical protein
MKGSDYQATQCHIQEEWKPQLHCCINLKICKINMGLKLSKPNFVFIYASVERQQTSLFE